MNLDSSRADGFCKRGMKFKVDRPLQSLLTQWEDQPTLAWLLSLLWLVIIVSVAFWWHLGTTGLVDETEPLFAEAARQMTVTGDWITPYFNGETRFDKPPLVYWLMAIAYRVTGVNEWAVRFPSALAGTVLTVFGFYTLRYFGFPRPGVVPDAKPERQQGSKTAASRPEASVQRQLWLSAWIGAALIALNPQTIAWGRIGVSDMLLSGCMGAALLAFFWGYAQPDNPKVQSRWYLAFYGLSALAVLTKGPVGIVLPGLIIGAFLLYMGNGRTVLREMQLVRGSFLFLLIAVPWYVLVIAANGESFINSFFEYHNVERFTRVVNGHWAPWYFFFLVVPIAFIPWSVHLPVAIARLRFWQMQHWRQQPRSSHLGIFALAWFVMVFLFFTIAVTKLPSYTIPLLPAAAILVALFWSDQITHPRLTRGIWISHIVNVGLLLAMAAAVFYSPHWMGNEPEMPDLPQAMRQSGVLIWGTGIWIGAAIASIILLLRRQGQWLWSVNAVGFIAFILLTVMPVNLIIDAQRQLPLRQLAATILQVEKPGEHLMMVGYRKPSIVFYTQRPAIFVPAPSDVSGEIQKLAKHLAKPNASVHSLLLLGRVSKLKEAGIKPDQYQTIAEAGVFRLARMEFAQTNKELKTPG
jgi:4-amino-4-deoxy-L-arabinose transferase-like glycosyltransferase